MANKCAFLIGIALIASTPAKAVGNWYVFSNVLANAAADANSMAVVKNECNGPGQSACTFQDTPFISQTHSLTKTMASNSANASAEPQYSWTQRSEAAAWGYADLHFGKLRLTSLSSGPNAGASTSVGFSDELTFNVRGEQPVEAVVKLHVDGSFSGDHSPLFGFSLGNINTFLNLLVRWAPWSQTPDVYTTANANFISFNDRPGWTQFGPETFVGKILIDPRYPNFQLFMSLVAGGSQGFAAFGNTASVSLELPPGVTFTSASGAFLTEASNAVPEPASWAMMIAGFGLTGCMARRRRQKPTETAACG